MHHFLADVPDELSDACLRARAHDQLTGCGSGSAVLNSELCPRDAYQRYLETQKKSQELRLKLFLSVSDLIHGALDHSEAASGDSLYRFRMPSVRRSHCWS